MPQCIGTTKTGGRCGCSAMKGNEYCKAHVGQKYNVTVEPFQSVTESMSESMSDSGDSTSEDSSSKTVSVSHVSIEEYGNVLKKVSELEEVIKKQSVAKKQPTNSTKRATNTNPTSDKKVRQMTDKGALLSAKWLFYQDNKNNKVIKEHIRKGLIAGDMMVKTKKMVNGEIVEQETIPWQLVKLGTDAHFVIQSEAVKNAYIKRAWAKYHDKIANATD